MTVLLVVLAALWLATCAYLVVVLRQIGAVRRQLEQRTGQDSPSAVTLALVVPQLEQLTSRVNEAVEQSRQASMRTRAEERRIRSFIADISHDLRTPLTSVRGYLQLLERTELDAVQRERLAAAHRQSVELGALVDRLYEYAYLLDAQVELEVEQIDLGVLVGECLLGMTAPIEAAGLAVDVAPPAQLQITTDREKLTRITQNLLRNAVQHGRDRLLIELGESKGGALLKVTNGVPDGKRIDAERLFDRFYTADRSRSGRTSGLGLSIVRVLAEQLGGEVTARQVAAGAPVTISVWLPHVAGA
ncbi:MAG TPA: HAMP domain-containing sensor histidine kinase [Brachybacterium sp.]|nr:HAMP domain-containing sensor histidine kinase [Brachybacterium sp.]